MTRAEIKSKFDEIVEFCEIGRFLDTPVKRYSSGMYVRLAFAVAAHLEPEILIVDEVLAVGDAGFQKKCLGKMEDVAGARPHGPLREPQHGRRAKSLPHRCPDPGGQGGRYRRSGNSRGSLSCAAGRRDGVGQVGAGNGPRVTASRDSAASRFLTRPGRSPAW